MLGEGASSFLSGCESGAGLGEREFAAGPLLGIARLFGCGRVARKIDRPHENLLRDFLGCLRSCNTIGYKQSGVDAAVVGACEIKARSKQPTASAYFAKFLGVIRIRNLSVVPKHGAASERVMCSWAPDDAIEVGGQIPGVASVGVN